MTDHIRLPIMEIRDVAESQLCCGCGACAGAEPNRYRMVDDVRFGRRPLDTGETNAGTDAIRVCPGVSLRHDSEQLRQPDLIRSLRRDWGPVLEVWEGYAADPEIRSAGSSGGAASALALACLEQMGMHGVLHTAAKADAPVFNETVMSTSRQALLSRTGSRYAPASPCEGLPMIKDAPQPCVFIGKPCDVAGARKAADLDPALARKLGMTIAFFCAGTPSTQGTIDLLTHVGVTDPFAVTSLRYRGNGWPGRWTVRFRSEDGSESEASLSYEESWGFLERYRQWRCAICPDHTGEFADVAVGDPWYRTIEEGEPGNSLILARTERGRALIALAAETGSLVLTKSDASLLPRSQPNLRTTRGRLWGQLLVLRLLRAAVPEYHGFPTFGTWLRGLGFREKIRSLLGTARRVKRRRLKVRVPVVEAASSSPKESLQSTH